ncbi:MAG: endonuclease/exonuclease/phosphatase family protein [Pseudomonadota bacterium]
MAAALLSLWLQTSQALADTVLRIATYATDLERAGPGLLYRDILTGEDEQVEAVAQIIADARPDILVLQSIDYDHNRRALLALRDRIDAYGWYLGHAFSRMPNAGLATGLDLDGDGRRGGPRDAQGYGEFLGQGGMAVLSRFPMDEDRMTEFTGLLWRDLPGALLPATADGPFPSADAQAVQRLSSVAHWVLPVRVRDKTLNILTFHASPPVFDGPEDRNGRRNHDEITIWQAYLDGALGALGPPPARPFVLAGDANLDPVDGDGRKSAIRALLTDDRFQDPAPRRAGAPQQGEGHTGDPALDTVSWPGPDPGDLRVSYVLPSSDLSVVDAGVIWPEAGALADRVRRASRHRLVWVDIRF